MAAMESARRVFEENCAACHGPNGRGQASLFPDLRDADWQWGGSEQQIEQSILAGRTGVMPGWAPALGEDGVAQVTAYVLAAAAGEDVAEHPGKPQYLQICAVCHGADGTGNALFGGSNLVDDVWLYGGSVEAVRHSIAVGRTGEMPAFAERLDAAQVRMLVAWLTAE